MHLVAYLLPQKPPDANKPVNDTITAYYVIIEASSVVISLHYKNL